MLGKLVLPSKRANGKGKGIARFISGGILAAMGLITAIAGLSLLDELAELAVAVIIGGVFILLFAVGMFILGSLRSKLDSESFIDVYSDGVKGVSLADFSSNGKAFELLYNEISNVDSSRNIVNIYTDYGSYKCIAINADEIRNAILKTKNSNI